MADTAPKTIVPPAQAPGQTYAPSTAAHSAPVPDVEMSGALKPSEPTKQPTPQPTTETTSANGAPSTTATSAQTKPKENAAEPATETKTTVEDTEMKDAPEPAVTKTPAKSTIAANGTPASKGKRKSTSGTPAKGLKKKQSKPKMTNLDAKPGEYYFARLRSYPPWPAIICDEEMLPTSLLSKRPVTAQREDGSWTEAYAEGGKKVSDRTFPIMFLHTNEFYWMPNTDLTPLTPDECKDPAEKGKSKALLEAYKVATEGHDLAYFKEILMAHAAALQEDEERREAKEAEKVEKAERKKRKSEVKAAKDEDVEMEDADGEVKKSSKKRKKAAAESDDEQPDKPVKTPKTTKLKLTTNKTPATAEKKSKEKATKPKAERKKKAVAPVSDDEAIETPEKEEEPELDPVEARKAREKEVLFLRHKLQKGFLSRDQAPLEDEMPQMATYIKKLEGYGEKLEVAIIRNTKINKVLKALIKLNTIPKDEEFHFRERSVKLLGVWNQLLGAEPSEVEKLIKDDKASPATTNGVHKEADEKNEKDVDETKDQVAEPAEAAEKVSNEVPSDAVTKTTVIHSMQNSDKPAEAPAVTEAQSEKPEEPKKDEAPVAAPVAGAADKAPESVAATTEATGVVKASE